ncbi:MAG: YfhO family protein [Clostridia bacterium]|nr:YfhO family protein [Clostridia bacterium]
MENEMMIPPADQRGKGIRARLLSLQRRLATAPSSYLVYCFLVPVILMYLLYIAMEIHPFGNGTVLVLDLNGQYVYFFEALRNIIYGEGSLLYTFFRGLGGEFMGMYAYYLASPLSYLVALFPQARIQEALLAIILIKTGLCGFTFGFYLHKRTKHPNKMVSVTFSVLYALCAYAVVYQSNMMWIDALIWLPILTYSIEQLVRHKKYKLFVISLALTVMSNYYIGYMTCIYVALYFCYFCFSTSEEERNPRQEPLHRTRALFRIGIFSLIALAIAAFVILGAYYSLTFGKSTFTDPSWAFKAKFSFLDFFTKFLPGAYDTVRPAGLPFVYCGVLTLLLVPVYFMSRRFTSREKVASLLFIAVFVLSFIASPLDLIWHGFQKPNWLNYRYSFMLTFFLLVLAYKGFGNLRRVGEKFVFCVGTLIILFATVCEKLEFESYVESGEKLRDLQTVWLTVFAVIALVALLCLLIRKKNPLRRESLAGILAAVVCLEVFCSSLGCLVEYDGDVSYSKYDGYNEFIGGLRPIVEEVKEKDDGFYRMEKLLHRKYNDNMALGIRGLSNSTSTLNSETIRFLNQMGYTARSHLSQYRGGTPVNDSLLGIKYLIDEKDSEKLIHYYDTFAENETHTAYYNPYALSLAYGVDSALADFSLEHYNTYFERLNALVSAMLGDEKGTDIFNAVSTQASALEDGCTQRVSGAETTYSATVDNLDASVTFSIVAAESAEYYFYTPSRKPVETKISVNDTPLGKYLGSDTRHIVSLGWFEAGETIDVTITLLEEPLTIYNHFNYFWYIDRTEFEESFSALKSNPQYEITEYTEDHLIGTITTTAEKQMIQTTIPYDEGWQIYVDGTPVEIYKTLDALIAFDIEEAGKHTLEMKYSPTIYKVGMILSIGGLTLFGFICVADLIWSRRKRRTHCQESHLLPGGVWPLDDLDEDEEARKLLPPPEPKPKKTLRAFLESLKKKNDQENDSPKGED